MPNALTMQFGWVDHPDRLAMSDTIERAKCFNAFADDPDDNADVMLCKAFKDVLGKYPDYPAQQIGDCESFGHGHGLDLLQCIDIAVGREPQAYKEICTEAAYAVGREAGGMLGGSDGCYGAAMIKGLTEIGAVPREIVGAYAGSRAKQWGRSGLPRELRQKAAEHKIQESALVETVEELWSALRRYPVSLSSNQGFTLTRDSTGLCEAKGTWPHCMLCAGRRTWNGERQFLILQSWGNQMPSGPLWGDQPLFSFWARGSVLSRMLAGRDCFAMSRFAGFPGDPIPSHWTYAGFA